MPPAAVGGQSQGARTKMMMPMISDTATPAPAMSQGRMARNSALACLICWRRRAPLLSMVVTDSSLEGADPIPAGKSRRVNRAWYT